LIFGEVTIFESNYYFLTVIILEDILKR